MAILQVLLTCLLITCFSAFGEDCEPAEIGTEHTITSTFTNIPDGAAVTWQIGNVLLYDSSRTDKDVRPLSYTGTDTELTIKAVKKGDAATFTQFVGTVQKYSCSLKVYKRASTPSCGAVTLVGGKISTSCTTDEVYPQAQCQFTLTAHQDSRIISSQSSISYSHNDPTPPGDYTTTCTLLHSVAGFKDGTWTVQVSMYPNIVTPDKGTNETAGTLSLALPTPTIADTNCPKGLDGEGSTNVRYGYIRQGAQASCMCTTGNLGTPRGAIQWTSTQTGSFENLESRDDAVTIKIKSPATFTCLGVSVLEGSNDKEYTPKYAYGPDSSPSVTLNPPGDIYLCDGQPNQVTVRCGVPANSYSPSVNVTIKDKENQVLITQQHEAAPTGQTLVSHSFTATGGDHTFRCEVENGIFKDIKQGPQSSSIRVNVPPNSPPNLQVTGSSVQTSNGEIWAKQGSDITVTCTPGGGAFPHVTSETVTCGGQTDPNDQFTMNREDLTCKCELGHVTRQKCGASTMDKEITVNAAYGPDEVKMTFTNHRSQDQPPELNLCTSEGIDLDVNCVVSVPVRPELEIGDFSLIKPDSFTTLQAPYLNNSGDQYMTVNRLKIKSGGNYSLSCEARNSKFTDIRQTLSRTVIVREPPSTAPVVSARSPQNGQVLIQGDDVTVTCEVAGGIPQVQSVNLTCGDDVTETDHACPCKGNHQTATSNGNVVSLNITRITVSWNLTYCTCKATHVTGCYDMTGALQLKVVEAHQVPLAEGTHQCQSTGAYVAYAVVATLLGTLGLEAAIAAIIYFVRRGKRQQVKRPKGTEYDTVGRTPTHYQNVTPPDRNYLSLDLPEQESKELEMTPRAYENVTLHDPKYQNWEVTNQEYDTVGRTPTHYQNVAPRDRNYLSLDLPEQESKELEMTPRAYENVTLHDPKYHN